MITLVLIVLFVTSAAVVAAPQPKVAKHHTVRCQEARRAVVFYRKVWNHWRSLMGQTGAQDAILAPCWHLRRARLAWRTKALAAKARWAREFNWPAWLPQHWINLAQCEEGLNWKHTDGSFEGAFAFATSTWDQYRYKNYPERAWQATPRQQYRVAQRIAARLTIAVPWGCWRGAQHAWVRAGLPEFGVYS